MSYSRWGSSRWYTFWDVYPENPDRDTACLTIDCENTFSAKELRENPEQCLERVRERYADAWHIPVTDKDLRELWVYINAFLTDVDEEFAAREAPNECT